MTADGTLVSRALAARSVEQVTHAPFEGPPLHRDGSRYTMRELAEAPTRVLRAAMRAGSLPRREDLIGWEFDGLNVNPLSLLIRARKFRKAFFEPRTGSTRGELVGCNIVVVQDGLDAAHRAPLRHGEPRRHSYFAVTRPAPGTRSAQNPNATLLDYSRFVSAGSVLRDYVVQVYPDDRNLLLGRAFVSLFGVKIHAGYFVLSRAKSHDFHG